MVYYVCRAHVEAKPIIKSYNMKRDMNCRYFEYFESENAGLIISGTGKINAAAAIVYMLSKSCIKNTDIAVNFSIGGSYKRNTGDLILADKIIDIDEEKAYYPDVLIKNAFVEGTVETYSNTEIAENAADAFDMEASGFFEAASKFLSPNQIQVIKLIAFNSIEGIDSDYKDIDVNNVYKIISYVDNMQDFYKVHEILKDEDRIKIKKVIENLKLTASMSEVFIKLYKSYLLQRGKSPILDEYTSEKVNIKNESKREYKKLIEQLSK